MDQSTQNLKLKIEDTIGALQRREVKIKQIQDSMSVKIKTMLDQSIATLKLQAQPVAHLKTRLSQELVLQSAKTAHDYLKPAEQSFSFYNQLCGILSAPKSWQWEFVFRESQKNPRELENATEMMFGEDLVIKQVKILY